MPKLTLNRVFAISLVGLLAGLALLFWLVFDGLEKALLQSAEQDRERNSEVVADSVAANISQASDAAAFFESLVQIKVARVSDTQSLRDALLAVLLRNKDISEATFTFAKTTGTDASGEMTLDPASVGQVSIFRAAGTPGFVHQLTWYQAGHYVASRSRVSLDGQETAGTAPALAPNPTLHRTFSTPVLNRFRGHLLWTDLHWFALDQAKPESQRRVEVSALKAIDYPAGQFAGVLRIGLFTGAIDQTIAKPPGVDTSIHKIFLCDNEGRLIALSGSRQYMLYGDDVRLDGTNAPAQVLAALQLPSLRKVTRQNPVVSDQFQLNGATYLCTFGMLRHTQEWIVGITVARSAYLGGFRSIRRHVVWGSLLLTVVIVAFGAVVLHGVSVAHSIILREANRMHEFMLEPAKHSSRLYDIDRVLASLERAKTAMRSMGKYVPLDLVRRLYQRDEEPHLGGEATELTVLFTDVKGFTEFAEAADADTVASRLGAYLGVMVSVIQQEKGTIDKFIGDSVMAFWNAPEPVPGRTALACQAALACRDALASLYASPEWGGLREFETRFGLHDCVASVGHFGSPERFNYTAIGDGINLASRIESLNKHYGTTIIVSASVRAAAGPGFAFRRLDRVAVKGKSESLEIYELIGDGDPPPAVAVYEKALDAWLDGDFVTALALAESQPDDPPSIFLAARCRHFVASPPADWQGVYAFESK